ncbi:CarD family transcriptional regulator [Methylobacterium sp. Leaf125]|uniref:Crp/Fnr family transcriptional regulator n=1 Tax=Methylobacterium sp. Leaf125 TaxID=1736265 RepID=UPI0006F440D6|nr:Crp/Fnr family transcriptional regulator [Methylobacterium sp. Leaf125]KQQ40866.1 CarD family transcriptional regulator [Methylobacterium sp. Leaf125]
MSLLEQSAVRNRLLRRLSPSDYLLLQPHLRSMPTELRQGLIYPHRPIQDLYFPEAGYASITTSGTSKVEVGIIGPEGVVGAAPVLLGSDRTPYDHFVQNAGEMLAIDAAALLAATEESLALRNLLLRFVQTLLVQTAQTAFANASYNIEVRLARWLLMCHDRVIGDELTVTHDFLSFMLGVQRTTVTLALQLLEGNRLIKARRGRIGVLDRTGLLGVAGDSYGVPEAEYLRLIEGA